MKITEEFVEMMICPACRAKVRLKDDASAVVCMNCRRAYPIEGEIVVMLPERATVEDEEPAASVS